MHTPRWYQDESVDAIYNYFASGQTGHPVVALPTATGKSLVMAEFVRRTMQMWPSQRFILATHVKELVEQDAEAILEQWPEAPLGIHSDGLKRRDTQHPIIFGGVASMFRNYAAFGHRDIMLIDEAHLLALKDTAMYQKLIKGLMSINKFLKVIGFSATPYRLGQGLITQDGLFTHICYDMTRYDQFNRLVDEGFLCPLIPRPTKTELDTSGVKLTAGEFNKDQLAAAVDKEKTTWAACQEMAEFGYDRKSWLIFASSIKHAEHIEQFMQTLGIDIVSLHSKLKDDECNRRIKAFRKYDVRGIVNYGKLTTGFNHPAIDFIGMLRPTMSPSLWVQMLGRGTRPSPGTLKDNCLVLDFARNTLRLGPINDPILPRTKKKGEPGVAPIRICPNCGVYNHARATHCLACGFEFPKIDKLVKTAGTDELIKRNIEPATPIVARLQVQHVFYTRHQRPGSPAMMKVSYVCGLKAFPEYVCFEHVGFAQKKAHSWWFQHMGTPKCPPTTDEALKYIGSLRKPIAIEVITNRKYPEITNVEYQ